MSRLVPAAALLGLCILCPAGDGEGVPPPPPTPRKPVVEVYHGVRILDDYKWLENANDPAVRQWTEAQNRHTRAVLDQDPGLPAIHKRLKELIEAASASYGSLQYQGGKLFALKLQPPKQQPFLISLRSADEPGSERILVDPNQLNAKGTTAIDFYVPSHDGRLVAVCLSEGGSEEGTVHVYDATDGKPLADVVPRVNYPTAGGSLAWNAANTGFYYTRYPRDSERPREDLNFYQQVYFHELGTPTAEDAYALGKGFVRIAENMLDSSADGRYVLDTVQNGDGGEFAHYLLGPEGKWLPLTRFEDRVTAAVFGPDQALYLLSLKEAPRGKVLRLPLATPELARAKVIVPESEAAIQGFRLGAARLYPALAATADRLYVLDSVGGPSQVRIFTHAGRPQGLLPILPVSSVDQIVPTQGDRVLFHNESFLEPPAWYRYDPASGKSARTALYETSPADFRDCEVRRDFAVSRDGTRVPLSILLRKGTRQDGRNPTLLTGYGGFGISLTPRFSAARRLWLEQGGIYVVANLRGGSEYGEAWHEAGKLTHKQNVFDDFIACARYLIDHKYTSPDRLAIEGGSNGGLLMGVALTQQPELFRAVVAHVGLYDMLLHDRHPNGAFNVPEYGSAKNPEQFRAIYAYSPYQHVKDGTAYPAVFLLAGANDGRVDPANSRKMAAHLQAATTSHRPVLLLISFGSGHGIGAALRERIEQGAYVYAFLFQQLGVAYRPVGK